MFHTANLALVLSLKSRVSAECPVQRVSRAAGEWLHLKRPSLLTAVP